MHPHALILDVEDIYAQLFYNFAYVHQNYYHELAQNAPTKWLSYSLCIAGQKTLNDIFNVGSKEQCSQIKLLEELNWAKYKNFDWYFVLIAKSAILS